jgi:hypothetical protein
LAKKAPVRPVMIITCWMLDRRPRMFAGTTSLM